MGDDDDSRWHGVLDEIRKMYEAWQAHQERVEATIGEYKKTVNNAISLLSHEALTFQDDIRSRLAADAAERLPRQKRADRKDAAVLLATGCLIALNLIAICSLVSALAWLAYLTFR